MIRLDNIGKQNGKQILFIEASATLNKGEKIGLVGPNGAGKTTLFRMITGQEEPDEGQVSVERGVTIGYFSQDVGDMSGRSAVAEVMDGAGPVSAVAAELKELEAAMGDPDQADDIETLVERYGEVQGRFEELGGYALEGRAQEVLAGLGFSQDMMDGDVGELSGGWKMRVALARILLMQPDAMLLDEPSNHLDLESLIWGQGSLRALAGCFGFSGDDVEKKCRVLSGGEKARLVMAKMLYDPPNFLVLDEPTNHLDMATKEMLITALSQYEGTMLFVSHDRHFLAALSNRVLELTPDGIHQYGGGYTEYVARTGHEAPGLRS
ncbi:MAG: ATP-binding cassette domain-containing protein [Rhizobiales bacterium]|nr:ATP-binding cassette domain-containing protein [Hyphomicrobiales bacterium]